MLMIMMTTTTAVSWWYGSQNVEYEFHVPANIYFRDTVYELQSLAAVSFAVVVVAVPVLLSSVQRMIQMIVVREQASANDHSHRRCCCRCWRMIPVMTMSSLGLLSIVPIFFAVSASVPASTLSFPFPIGSIGTFPLCSIPSLCNINDGVLNATNVEDDDDDDDDDVR